MAEPALSPDKIEQLRQLYKAKVPMHDILHQVGISRPTAYKYIHAGGGTNRYAARPDHTVWDQAFDVLTDEAAYWVGLLITDGSIVGGGRRVKLSLQVTDTPTLERFKEFVRTSAPIEDARNGSSVVRFTSPYMCKRLGKLGIVPRKTTITEAPECLLDNRHFWRGVVDGDGCAFSNPLTSPRLSLCGASSAALLPQWAAVCSARCKEVCSVRVRPQARSVSDVILYGKDAFNMAHWVYSGCTPESPAMERKLEGYHEMCLNWELRGIPGINKNLKRRKAPNAQP